MFILTTLSLFFCVLATGTHAATTLARCNADKYSVPSLPFNICISAASAFCATITAGGTTATNFPTRATSACGTSASLYISACACGPTCSAIPTPTPTPTPCAASGSSLVANGDFECGIAPWIVQNLDQFARAGVTSKFAHTGQHSFESRLLYDRSLQNPAVSVRLSSPVISVQPNVPYRLTFWSYFDNHAAGFIGIQFNGEPKRTLDAGDGAGWGVWKSFSVDYTPLTDKLDFTLEFLYGRVASVVRVDGIVFDYIH
ncbi:hypothetical protein CORC01_08372 [Colletotrichum orchidophilum]|uniref:CBM-cenC domain-containing protein n=1 Tax=Colletotrichum orchidophilum TaxID=1209926 RepID=A0A1G4B4E6_9PEZI|nr:uncharacterized protein CORC01_08372 [Colletotrichum orchidophilum]OHE96300.1 hypothetical protein CORC01_08372 [Colletotrichum orchidophilum]